MAYAKKMEKMFLEAKYSELEKFCKSQLELAPKDPDLLFYYASALESLEKHKEAETVFERLFKVTNDRLFRVCKAISAMGAGDLSGGNRILAETTDEEEDADNLFFIFRVAVNSMEPKTAKTAITKAFANNPKKTVNNLQRFFEKTETQSPQRRIFFITLLNFLKELEKWEMP